MLLGAHHLCSCVERLGSDWLKIRSCANDIHLYQKSAQEREKREPSDADTRQRSSDPRARAIGSMPWPSRAHPRFLYLSSLINLHRQFLGLGGV